MQEINTNNSVFSDLSIRNRAAEETGENELGQSAFLELMVAQLQNQDPLSPQENTAFVAQLAQFSSVEGIDRLNNNFDTFTNSFVANQALQASSLVGRSVSVPTDIAVLEAGDVVSAAIDVPASAGEVSINIFDDSGSLVDQVALGPQPAGELVTRWDGLNFEVNGELIDWQSSQENGLPPGTYRYEVLAPVEGTPTELSASLSANVNSVTVGPTGSLVLNLAGIGAVNLSDVRQFNE